MELKTLRQREAFDLEAAAQIPTAEASLAELDQQLQRRKKRIAALTIKAPHAGRILPSEDRPEPADTTRLGQWNGRLLDAANQGCYIDGGTQVCWIAESDQWEVAAIIPENQVSLVQIGNTAKMSLDAFSSEVVEGRVVEVARERVSSEQAGFSLSAHQAGADQMPHEAAGEAGYRARILLDSQLDVYRVGMREWRSRLTSRRWASGFIVTWQEC